MIKKLLFVSLISLSFATFAQFLDAKPPTTTELTINNSKNVSQLLQIAQGLWKSKDYKNLLRAYEKIVALKPDIPVFKYKLAELYSLNNLKSEAFTVLIELQKQGFYFDLAANKNFENIKSFPVFDYIKKNLDANNSHFGEADEAFNINKSFSGLLFESIAYDEKNLSFLMGSLRDGSVIKIDDKGKISLLIEAAKGGETGPWATVDLAVDVKNNVLWLASSSISQFGKMTKENIGKSGLFKYNLTTGKFIKSYLMPEKTRPNVISSIHLTAQGDLYVLNVTKNVLLKLEEKSEDYSIVFTTQEYKLLRNVTSDETGNFIYLSDIEKGIVVINMEKQTVFNLRSSQSLNLTNISDLIYDDHALIILQSGFQPERILRIVLDKDKTNVETIFPIESSNPAFNSLSYGVVVDEGLFYIANSQLPKTNKFGGLNKNQEWENMVILGSPKHYNEEKTLKYQKTIEKYKKAAGK